MPIQPFIIDRNRVEIQEIFLQMNMHQRQCPQQGNQQDDDNQTGIGILSRIWFRVPDGADDGRFMTSIRGRHRQTHGRANPSPHYLSYLLDAIAHQEQIFGCGNSIASMIPSGALAITWAFGATWSID